jgi:ceramide glucosyltransferase
MTPMDFYDLLRAALLVAALLLVLLGRRAILTGGSDVPESRGTRWPEVALIVPATGNPLALASCVRSLLRQDYPALQLVFLTRDSEDEANAVILQEIEGNPSARLIHSGRCERCGQKNHNLLAGIRAVGKRPEILAFCDSTRVARPAWMKGLVSPLLSGVKRVATGYHHVIPQDQKIAALGHACSVLILYLTKGIGPMNQPWGGATAIRRDLFESMNVELIWGRNVVDDVSLAACLKKNRVPVAMSPGSCLETAIAGEGFRTWTRWLIRQWMYIKLCFPGTWLAAGL